MTPNGRPIIRPTPMPMDLSVALRDITQAQAATMLAQAQQAYFKLLTGQLPSGVETPQLGRVTFATTTAADMQRLIDYLSGVVAGSSGASANVRKPISFFGWP